MRVGIFHPWNPYDNSLVGGIESYIREMLEFLPLKVDVSLITWASNAEDTNKRINMIALRKFSLPFTPKILLFSISIVQFKVIYQKKFDLIILHRPELVFLVKFLFPNSRIFLFLHTDQKSNFGKTSDSLWKRFPILYERIIPKAYLHADRIYLLSKPSFNYVTLFNKNVTLLRATAADAFWASENTCRKGLVWVGRLEVSKNPILGVKIMNELAKSGLNCTLIGEGALLNQCLKVKSDDVDHCKFVDRVELSRILKSTKFVLLTSHFEGAPKLLVEALIAGCQIICTKESDPEELHLEFPERIFISHDNSVQDFFSIIHKLGFEEGLSENSIKFERIQEMTVSRAIPILWKDIIEKQ
jgi:glycosyltransferase involved in cell wall biosynthesis